MKKRMNIKKRIALIAHDHMKDEMISWVRENKEELAKHRLCGTGTTAMLIEKLTGLEVEKYKSGPLGGDAQISAEITNGNIDMAIFFSDPLAAQPHDPDIRALLRLAILYDIPLANNRATASFIIKSEYMHSDYERNIMDSGELASEREKQFSHLK
ncbi:MAG: methylglyoxal synthase [Tissierellia bacterium]|nr:methylglyoxal synthase [Tissierellia bacterium]